MISVIISLYNKEHYIESTIQSVLQQTYHDFEIIIIDDGSTDNSAQKTKAFNDSRIKYLYQENQGVSSARNYGIKASKGDFIAFLDADDIWKPGILKAMYDLTQQYPQESVFGVAQVNRPITALPSGISIIKDFCSYFYCFCTGSLLIKKEVFERVGLFKQGIQIGEDFDMWLRIGCHYNYIYLNEPFLIHPDVTENNLSLIRNISKTYPFWEWYSYPYTPKNSLYRYTTDRIVSTASRLIKEGRFSEGLTLLKKAKGFYALRPRIYLFIKILLKKK
jgi:glycosyltransferase involved in cell wall biosynthesis